jgi:hypothetical protein
MCTLLRPVNNPRFWKERLDRDFAILSNRCFIYGITGPRFRLDRNDDMLLTKVQLRGLQGRDTLIGHIKRTGRTIAGDPIWTAGELATLRLLYPDRQALAAALPGRTSGAIAQKTRMIGLVPPWRIWTTADAVQLRRPYMAGVPVTTLTEMFPGKSKRQIWGKAFAMGYRRPRRPPKPTGMPLVDSIRARAFEFRITMTDLDAFVARKRYFVSPHRMDWTALQRAMILLGGTPVVRWREP